MAAVSQTERFTASDVKYSCRIVRPMTDFLVAAANNRNTLSHVSLNSKKAVTASPCVNAVPSPQFSNTSRMKSAIQFTALNVSAPSSSSRERSPSVTPPTRFTRTRCAVFLKYSAKRAKTSTQCRASHLPKVHSNASRPDSPSGSATASVNHPRFVSSRDSASSETKPT